MFYFTSLLSKETKGGSTWTSGLQGEEPLGDRNASGGVRQPAVGKLEANCWVPFFCSFPRFSRSTNSAAPHLGWEVRLLLLRPAGVESLQPGSAASH